MKLSNIKHLILTTILCALTVIAAKAQIGTYGTEPNTATISTNGSTLTIDVTGDASLIGANWQFTNTTNLYKGASEPYSTVSYGDSWNDSESYRVRSLGYYNYTAIPNFESTYVTEHQDYTKTFNANAAANLYYNNPWGAQEYTPVLEGATPDFSKIWPTSEEGSYYCTRSGEEGHYVYTRLKVDEWDNATYVTSTTVGEPYKVLNNIPSGVYYSANGTDEWVAVYNTNRFNETGVYATRSEVYAYSEPLTFDQLKAGGYIKNNSSFINALVTAINNGDYTDIVVNGGTIDADIIKTLTHPAGNANTDLKNLDLGGTTTSSFVNAFNETTLTSLETLTLPMYEVVDGKMILPAYILGTGYTWVTHHLTKVIVPEGYTKIGDDAFFEQSALTEVNLPNSLVEIGDHAFHGCSMLSKINKTTENDVVFPTNLVTIGEWAFSNTNLKSSSNNLMLFPKSLRTIKAAAFNQVHNIEYIKLNEGLEFVGNSVFYLSEYDKATLKNADQKTITFPSSIKYLGPASFFNRVYSDVYFTGTTAPVCPVGPSVVNDLGDMAAFNADTHMGNNGFNPNKVTGSEADDATQGYANRENYVNNGGVYFSILHFPAGITIDEAKTYKDITRKYVTARGYTGHYEDENFYYGGYVELGEEPEDNVRSFQDYGSGSDAWISGGSFHTVAPGYEDTYLGAQKIWPSQNQWMRAYTTVANGVEWLGVVKYRPTVTDEMIELMKMDNLMLYDPSTSSRVSISGNYEFTEASAAQYNETLPGAVKGGSAKTTWTKEDADVENAKLPGAISEGQPLYYTAAEIAEHNASLPGAVKEGDVAEEAHEVEYYTYAEYHSEIMKAIENSQLDSNLQYYTKEYYNENLEKYKNGQSAWLPLSPIKSPASDAVYYTAETANAYNATLPEAINNTTVKGTATAEQAAHYNASLDGAVHAGEAKTTYTAEEAKEHNATLDGHVVAGGSTTVANAFADYISKILYQSTRRFVLADDTAPKDNQYEIPMEGHNWWTICIPFDLTKSQVNQIFGEGTHVCLFSGVDRDETTNPKELTLRFQHDVYLHKTIRTYEISGNNRVYHYEENFDINGAAPADNDIVMYSHQSYMIFPMKTSEDAVSYFDKNGTKYFVVPEPIMVEGEPLPTRVLSNANKDVTDHTEYRFVGNYKSNNVEGNEIVSVKVPQYSYFYAKKKNDPAYKFWFVENNQQSWKKNKSLVQNHARGGGEDDFNNFFNGNSSQAKQTSIFGWNDEETTSVENMVIVAGEGEDASSMIYGINGQLMNINSVRPGNIYIKNGKKFLAK